MAKQKCSKFLLYLMVCLTAVPTAIALDIYAPSLPFMVGDLHTTTSLVQMTISIYMIAGGVGVFLWGPLSDRFGRRKVLLLGMPIAILGTIICIFSGSIGWLMFGRIMQGFGVSPTMFVCVAIAADVFKEKELNKVMSVACLVYSVVPILAPVIGGFLQKWFGWQASFVFVLAFLILYILLVFFKLPETHKPTAKHVLTVHQVSKNYLSVISTKTCMFGALAAICTWSLVISFSVLGPFLVQVRLGYSAHVYGLIALFVGFGYMLGNTLNGKLLKYKEADWLSWRGLCLAGISALILFVFSIWIKINVWYLMAPICFCLLGSGVMYPNMLAEVISAKPELAGTANALLSALMLAGTMVVTSILALFDAHSFETLSGAYVILVAIVIFSFGMMKYRRKD